MPVEPHWLLDALGMMQFSPNDRHEGPVPHGDGTVEIRTVMQTRSGVMTKSTVIDARRAWVLEQHVYDTSGTLLASAVSRSHRFYPGQGVSLPQEVEIRMPAAQMSLSIDVGTVALNQVANNPALWNLPVMSGYQQIDLGTAPPGAFPAISAAGSKDWSTLASPSFVGLTPQTVQGAGAFSSPPPVYPSSTPLATYPAAPQGQSPPQQPVAYGLPPGGILVR